MIATAWQSRRTDGWLDTISWERMEARNADVFCAIATCLARIWERAGAKKSSNRRSLAKGG